ncbi:DUF21 domain-containing protein [Desulfoluna sp.]|uniref:DUF21 domain-containing protein n=1 Tax=Desulfoluna sp. TaxID=2045199 RepID=UPI0026139345|nr:DUF21 domain-containing protein [Desulfoluna sp.]
MIDGIIWAGIAFCITQSAVFSGLNLAFFSISKLRLEIEASQGNKHALRVLKLRKDSNFLLTTILWGNVGINVLLALLANSVMAGLTAFLFSTVLITFLGEIIPQAYFSRHALKMAYWFSPLLRVYQCLLFLVAKPCALLLDQWLGKESIHYLGERDMQKLITMHMKSDQSDIDPVEGKGALNFLALDDIPLAQEGELIDPKSIIPLPFQDGMPVFPASGTPAFEDFIDQIESSGKKWIILIDDSGYPKLALNSDSFLRSALFHTRPIQPMVHCHRPILTSDGTTALGSVLTKLKVHPERSDDDVIDDDLILLWGETKKVITGADILGRLLRGIADRPTT